MTHAYTSTACQHAELDNRPELHDRCGQMQRARGDMNPPHCKFCPTPCDCRCHTTEESA